MNYEDNLNNKLKKTYDTIIIGGGPAGLAAAIRCWQLGIKDILVVERDSYPGGILPQCIHGGFGLKVFNRELTGPEYSRIFIDKLKNTGAEVMLNTMALSIKIQSSHKSGIFGLKADSAGLKAGSHGPKADITSNQTEGLQTVKQEIQTVKQEIQTGEHGSNTGRQGLQKGERRSAAGTSGPAFGITVAGKKTGFKVFYSKSVILALGCRERTRGQIMIPGARPAGVFTAGLAQRMVNIEGYLPGKEIVILGSGDIGLIMARRLTLEGCKVKGVFELMPFSTGLLRNISQCLEDYDIPLYLSHIVTNIIGGKRLEAVQVCMVDSTLKPVLSSARTIKCDTLLLSVGLIPENELAKTCGIILDKNTGGPAVDEDFQTSVPGIFSCGNSLFVYDLVDNVTEDGYKAAENAALYLVAQDFGKKAAINVHQDNLIDIIAGENAAYAVPQKISGKKDVDFKIRAKVPLKNATVELSGTTFKKKFKYVNPGEMLFINMRNDFVSKGILPKDIIINIRGDRPA